MKIRRNSFRAVPWIACAGFVLSGPSYAQSDPIPKGIVTWGESHLEEDETCSGKGLFRVHGVLQDQYGAPVSGGEIEIVMILKHDGGISKELSVQSDANGRFHVDAGPTAYCEASLNGRAGYDSEGRTLQEGDGARLYFHKEGYWSPDSVWNNESSPVRNETGTDRSPVILRVRRVAAVQRIGKADELEIEGGPEGADGCLDAQQGRVYKAPHQPCDIEMIIRHCPGPSGSLLELRAAPGGGVVLMDKQKMSEGEAPAGGYQPVERLAWEGCPKNYMPEVRRTDHSENNFFFHARGGALRGSVEFNYCTFERDCSARYDPAIWSFIKLRVNPRGERSLTDQNLAPLPWPLTVPYRDPWKVNYNLITIEAGATDKHIVFIGYPGALEEADQVKCGWNSSIDGKVDPDGSFRLVCNGEPQSRGVVTIRFNPKDRKNREPELALIPLVKFTNQVRAKGAH